jgi:hypothetical protein
VILGRSAGFDRNDGGARVRVPAALPPQAPLFAFFKSFREDNSSLLNSLSKLRGELARSRGPAGPRRRWRPPWARRGP